MKGGTPRYKITNRLCRHDLSSMVVRSHIDRQCNKMFEAGCSKHQLPNQAVTRSTCYRIYNQIQWLVVLLNKCEKP